MSRSLSFFPFALVTFSVGAFLAAFSVPPHNAERTTTEPTVEKADSVNHMCAEEEMEYVWTNFDKEQFLQLKRSYIERNISDDPEFREFWETRLGIKDFNCTYFGGATAEDLNGDGSPEFIVTGRFDHRDSEEFIYAQTNTGLKLILIDGYNIQKQVEGKRRHGFPDITYFSNWSGGGREVKTYRFNGSVYVESECFSDDYKVGESVETGTPERTRTKCDRRFGTP